MRIRQVWMRRAVTIMAIVVALGISRTLRAYPELIHRGTATFSTLNWLYGLSLLFLLLGAPVWLLMGSTGAVADAAERRALRIDVTFVLAAFVFVLFLILMFATQI